jgi:DNA primase
MQVEKKLRALRRILGEEKFVKGDEHVFVCPKQNCRKDKPKLSVNIVTDSFHCWICGFGAKNLVPILRLDKGSKEFDEYLSELNKGSKHLTEEKTYEVPQLPKEFISLSTVSNSIYFRHAISYLKNRGVEIEDILKMKLGYCESGEYKNRIIFPSFDDKGFLNFFVGRIFFGQGINYKHGQFDKDIIFNDYLIDWEKPVIITEGPFDAIKAGDNVIPLLGSILREDMVLFSKIVRSGVDVFMAMDSDAFSKQVNIIAKLLKYGVSTYYVDLFGKKDVGDMSKDEFKVALSKAKNVSSDVELLKMRVYA